MERCYPKFLYHAEYEPKIVYSAEEHAAMGPGWVESPADLPQAQAPAPDPAPAPNATPPGHNPLDGLDLAQLRALAHARGVRVHHKSGRAKILEALKAAGAA